VKALAWCWLMLACYGCGTPAATPNVLPTEAPFYAPDFTLPALNGGTVTLNHLRGQWVIVNFWATWCVPCIEEMPTLQAIADAYPDSVIVLGVNLREAEDDVQAFAQTHSITFPILLAPPDEVLLAYNVVGLPQTLIVNRDGEVVFRRFGPLSLNTFPSEFNDLITPVAAR
jgi:thiol-disulfide isomerase/thioredoxin